MKIIIKKIKKIIAKEKKRNGIILFSHSIFIDEAVYVGTIRLCALIRLVLFYPDCAFE